MTSNHLCTASDVTQYEFKTRRLPHLRPTLSSAMFWLSVHDALCDTLLAATTLHSNTVDEIALLCLVAQLASFVCPRRSRSSVDRRQLAELPGANSLEKSHNIRLLLVP